MIKNNVHWAATAWTCPLSDEPHLFMASFSLCSLVSGRNLPEYLSYNAIDLKLQRWRAQQNCSLHCGSKSHWFIFYRGWGLECKLSLPRLTAVVIAKLVQPFDPIQVKGMHSRFSGSRAFNVGQGQLGQLRPIHSRMCHTLTLNHSKEMKSLKPV